MSGCDRVLWTGIPQRTPQISQRPVRRRPLRWPATTIGFVIAVFVQIGGPLKPFGALNEQIDEWGRTVRARSYLVTFGVFAVATMPGIGVLLQRTVLAAPESTAIVHGLGALLFTLLTIGTATPTAYASWRWQWRDAD